MATIRLAWDTTTNKYLLHKGLDNLFDNTLREAKVEWKRYLNDEKTDQQFVDDLRMGGLSGMAAVPEGTPLSIQSPVLGGTKRYTQTAYGTGFRITFQMKRFEKIKLVKSLTRKLGIVMAEGKDVEVNKIFNYPTTVLTGFDGLHLAEDSHTGLLGGSTSDNYDNYLNADLSYSALAAARYYFETLVDDMGMWMGATPTDVMVCPTLQTTAEEIFKSSLVPHELSNTANVLRSLSWKPSVNHRLTATNRWIVLAKDNPNYDLKVITSMEPEITTQDATDYTKDSVVLAYQMFCYGFGDQRLCFVGK